MPNGSNNNPATDKNSKVILGLDSKQRIKIYLWGTLGLFLAAIILTWAYLRPERWYSYTDKTSIQKSAKDVELGYVAWEKAEPAEGMGANPINVKETSISADGAHMVYSSGINNSNLFLRIWNGKEWGEPRSMRALNSNFNERSPSLCQTKEGKFLFFSSDRAGGQGGYDIWVSKWDGAEYAWPLPLTPRVNTPFDEIDPATNQQNMTLYFASNRPHQTVGISEKEAAKAAEVEQLADVSKKKVDYDLYSAEIASETAFDLIVERQLSMLYSLREGALADSGVMKKLGGSKASENAVDKALAFLAENQEEDGRWDIRKSGGQAGHDVSSTAFSLLAFYGRGERHDEKCSYQSVVKKGIDWLINEQDIATGDLRGKRPAGNGMYSHGIGALAMVEAYGVTKDNEIRPYAQAAIDFIADSQHEEGGWRYRPNERGDLSVSGWFIMALVSAEMSGLNVNKKTMDRAIKFLDRVSGGKDGGSYGYTDSPGKRNSGKNALNAVGFFCSQILGRSPNTKKAFESANIIDAAGFQLNDIYYVYYGTLAAYQHQGPVWEKWLDQMQNKFVSSQLNDGSWPVGAGHGNQMGKYIATALVTLCLEAHYRYTPIYGLGFEPEPEPNLNALPLANLPQTPLFRHAKQMPIINSPADDKAPEVTKHGDFIYFSSNRVEGLGQSDIYRARLSKGKTMDVTNLGEEINGPFNETNPALRMAGFHLLFNSDRSPQKTGLFDAKSKRLEKRHNYLKLPSFSWIGDNLFLTIALLLTVTSFVFLTRRALKKGLNQKEVKNLISDS